MALADKLTLVPSAQYGVVYGRFVQGVGGPSLVSGVDENPDAALSPVPGLRITFKPSTDLMISDPATQDSFAPTAYSAYTDADGFFEISLFATDIEKSRVENWYWEAEIYSQNPGGRSFQIGSTTILKGLEVKANSAVWLGDIITHQDASGNYVTRGRDGRDAYDLAVSRGYEGTEAEFSTMLSMVTPSSFDLGEVSGPVALDVLHDLTTLDAHGDTVLHLPTGTEEAPVPDGLDLAIHVRSGNTSVTWADGVTVDRLPVPEAPEAWYWAVRENGAWYVKVQQDLFYDGGDSYSYGPLHVPDHIAPGDFNSMAPLNSLYGVLMALRGSLSMRVSGSVYPPNYMYWDKTFVDDPNIAFFAGDIQGTTETDASIHFGNLAFKVDIPTKRLLVCYAGTAFEIPLSPITENP